MSNREWSDEIDRVHGKQQRLSEKCNQQPLFEFQGFIIRPFDGFHLWMENPQGEGTMIRKAFFLGALIKLFDRHF